MSEENTKPILKRNDQGMPGWNVYYGLKQRFKKITFYPEAGTFYFEVETQKPSKEMTGQLETALRERIQMLEDHLRFWKERYYTTMQNGPDEQELEMLKARAESEKQSRAQEAEDEERERSR